MPAQPQIGLDSAAVPRSSEALRIRLPRRDYILLPLLSVGTLVLLFAIAEATCRILWRQHYQNPCYVESQSGVHYLPNCVSRIKFAESPWVENRYNECGYRNAESCGPKPAGVLRIAVLGSSVVSGLAVPYEQTFVPLMQHDLSLACGRKIQVENISTDGNLLHIYQHSAEAMAMNPDLLVLVLGPVDMKGRYSAADLANRNHSQNAAPSAPADGEQSIFQWKRVFLRGRAMYMAKHFLYEDIDFGLKTLRADPMESDYMLVPSPPEWKQRMADTDLLIGEMAEKSKARKIPLVLAPIVSESQAMLLSSHRYLSGFDPMKFQNDLSAIASAHHVPTLNLYEDFADIYYTRLFYVADGHPNAEGHSVLERGLVREILANHMIPSCSIQ